MRHLLRFAHNHAHGTIVRPRAPLHVGHLSTSSRTWYGAPRPLPLGPEQACVRPIKPRISRDLLRRGAGGLRRAPPRAAPLARGASPPPGAPAPRPPHSVAHWLPGLPGPVPCTNAVCAQAATRPSRRRAAPAPARPSHGQHEPARKRNAVLLGQCCTAGRSRARAGAPTLSCPRVGAPLERPRAFQAPSLPPFRPPLHSGPAPARVSLALRCCAAGQAGRAGHQSPPSCTPRPGRQAPGLPPAPWLPGPPGSEVHSARRPRQGGLAEAPAWLHTSSATHTRRGARRQGAGGSTCSGSRACISSPTADLAGRAGRCGALRGPRWAFAWGLVRGESSAGRRLAKKPGLCRNELD